MGHSISRRHFFRTAMGALTCSASAMPAQGNTTVRALNKLAARLAAQQAIDTPDNVIALADGNVLLTEDGRYIVTH